jgi:hypothetical protein
MGGTTFTHKGRAARTPCFDLDLGLAAIGENLRAVYEAGFVGGEKEGNLRDFFWLTNPTERNRRGEVAGAVCFAASSPSDEMNL